MVRRVLLIAVAVFMCLPARVVAQNFRILHTFGGVEGLNPSGRLVLAPDGNFYGGTYGGGAAGLGTIFRMSPVGDVSTVFEFHGPDGSHPRFGLTVGHDGNLYGVTDYGGVNGDGTIFRLTLAGQVTLLHSFNGFDGYWPDELVEVGDGYFYGVTHEGGATWPGYSGGNGTVFRISTDGSFTSLYSFTPADGRDPNGPLAIGSDGNLYGTLQTGVPTFSGAFFRVSPDGNVTILQKDSKYAAPAMFGPVIQGSDSAFYGQSGLGFFFRVTAANGFETLVWPGANLIQVLPTYTCVPYLDGNGVYWGTAFVYRPWMTGYTQYDVLFNYNPSDGAVHTYYLFPPIPSSPYLYRPVTPVGGVIPGPDGNLYGVTSTGGSFNDGTIYEFVRNPALPPSLTASPDGDAVRLAWKANSPADSYNIYMGRTSGGESTVPIASAVAGTSYSIAGLTAGPNYYFTVTAVNAAGESAPSNEASASPHAVLSYTAGLSLFSEPYDYPDVTLDALFGYANVKLAVWDPGMSRYVSTPDAGADAIRLGKAYWARFPLSGYLMLDGVPADTGGNFTESLSTGWNMIGDPFFTPMPLDSLTFGDPAIPFAQATSGTSPLIWPAVWAYDPVAAAYVAAHSLDPGQGYWMWSNADTVMHVPPGQ